MPNRYKFRLGDIVTDEHGDEFIVVDRVMHIETSKYLAIPRDRMGRRIGVATWKMTYKLDKTGMHSNTGSVRTYRANKALEAQGGRGCKCQCCIHTALDTKDFTNLGSFRFEEGEDDGEA